MFSHDGRHARRVRETLIHRRHHGHFPPWNKVNRGLQSGEEAMPDHEMSPDGDRFVRETISAVSADVHSSLNSAFSDVVERPNLGDKP
jgi:hypothetical protein